MRGPHRPGPHRHDGWIHTAIVCGVILAVGVAVSAAIIVTGHAGGRP